MDQPNSGFTILELIVCMGILGLLLAVAVPNIASLSAQMSASEVIRTFGYDLSQLRAEARRMKTPILVAFNSSGYSWDLGANGSIDGTHNLVKSATWGSSYSNITFNGQGLVRGIGAGGNYSVVVGGTTTSLTLNSNGHVSY